MSSAPDSVPLSCRLFGHSRTRRVWHGGDGYRALCKRCGVELGRDRGERVWHVMPHDRD